MCTVLPYFAGQQECPQNFLYTLKILFGVVWQYGQGNCDWQKTDGLGKPVPYAGSW